MKRINYSSVETIRRKFVAAMSGALNEPGWQHARAELIRIVDGFNEHNLPLHHKDVLVADFRKLAEIYVIYCKNNVKDTHSDLHKRLMGLFNYDYEKVTNHLNSKIRRFFIENENLFGISTCHYCDMSYINVYGTDFDFTDALDLLNKASKEFLKEFLGYADSTIRKIARLRDYRAFSSGADFNSRVADKRISFQNISKKVNKAVESHSHFDLDHFLDKARCPITALSVFNFVPSCTICNQRLKHSSAPGDLNVRTLCHHSPTCNNYTFETDVRIKVVTDTGVPFLDYVKNKDKCRIEFICNGKKGYDQEIKRFHLRERYQFHRIEALRLMDLRQRYDHASNISEISRLVYGDSSEPNRRRVRDDIFQTYFKEHNSRAFSKLFKDILSK